MRFRIFAAATAFAATVRSQSMMQTVLPRMTAAGDQALQDAGLPART